MLTYKFYKTDGDVAFYHYFPQGKGNAGVISIDKKTSETVIVRPSDNDFGNRFAFKLIKRLREFFDNEDYEQEGIIAWY